MQFANGVRGVIECGAGGGRRAVTRNGVMSGPGGMDYDHDIPPYLQDIVNWLDDPEKVHPCNGETASQGFQVMMAACRSVVQRGKTTLPLGPGEPEMESLKNVLS